MSSRRNFLDADNSIMERNLRFVKVSVHNMLTLFCVQNFILFFIIVIVFQNDLEENLNQYFGGSAGRGNSSANVTVPPRDYKVVQPKPGKWNRSFTGQFYLALLLFYF